MWAKYSGTCRLVVSVVYDELICDDAFELKNFRNMKKDEKRCVGPGVVCVDAIVAEGMYGVCW